VKLDELKRKRQHNVQEQNALRKHAMIQCTRRLYDAQENLEWLVALLNARTATISRGVLIELGFMPAQEGDLVSGLWLSSDRQFFEFEVMLPRQSSGDLVVEKWEEVTQLVEISAHLPGTGKSPGFLALEILGEYE
jgi:hypothetical protein